MHPHRIRIGELCALKWSDINVQTKLLKIDKTMIRTYTKEDEVANYTLLRLNHVLALV